MLFPHSVRLQRTSWKEVNPNVANVGGLQIQGVKGDVVVLYFEPLTTQNLMSSGVPDVLGRSSKSEAQRVNKRAISTLFLKITGSDFQEILLLLKYLK
jgi:hypothetical protein